jgi:hypothetical protein
MTENPLGYEKIPKLLKNFAVPSIVASLVGSIQDYMVEAEKRMFAELVRDKRLGQDAYLPKDGSLEYKIMKSGREDLRTLQKIKHNYSWVIGVSKSFNPESCLDHTGKPNSNYIADLPVFQRFIIKPFYECLV